MNRGSVERLAGCDLGAEVGLPPRDLALEADPERLAGCGLGVEVLDQLLDPASQPDEPRRAGRSCDRSEVGHLNRLEAQRVDHRVAGRQVVGISPRARSG